MGIFSAKELGIPLLRFWESDLKNDPNKCKEKIQALIEKQKLI